MAAPLLVPLLLSCLLPTTTGAKEEYERVVPGGEGPVGPWYRGGPRSTSLAEALALALAQENRRAALTGVVSPVEEPGAGGFLHPVVESRGRLENRGRLAPRGLLEARGLAGARGVLETRGRLGPQDVVAGRLDPIGRLSRTDSGLQRFLQAELELARVERLADMIVSEAQAALVLEQEVDWVQGGRLSEAGAWIRGGRDTDDGLWIRNKVLPVFIEEEEVVE